ncbi:transposase family protein [Streptomyces scabiei]|uniref:transposase family protein n=1 Tax=Streptomyces TaxID=1883 RepID=UPI00298EFFEF|nr:MULTISPECIES: transposase family protein [Streptomyces]MDW8471514.1 transposase family protein [Streptomyces scabiei]MDX2573786.1 transposase family protein [Streptomyces scabiei]MDX3153769.1 transposase family protein [Streptomyces scabiei]MDX3162047.1 transposase family protein [Streptomyces scabiei]MDX3257209.1 transposase family protein [Streptomyces scabiei]
MTRVEDRPADASSLIPTALDQLREQSDAVSEEVPGLLARLADVSDPRDPREVRHHLTVVLALTACAVPAEATSQYTLWSRKVGQLEPDTPTTVTPATRPMAAGESPNSR